MAHRKPGDQKRFFKLVTNKWQKIHIFINIFMNNNNNNNYYYYYLLKFLNNLLYDTYDMIWYVHTGLRTLTLKFTCCNFEIIIIKLITSRWAWPLVPTKLVEPGNALAWGGGIHGNPASGPHQAPSHWTIQWNTYRPNTYLAHTKREGGMGKTKAQTGTQTASYCNNTLQRTASKQLRI